MTPTQPNEAEHPCCNCHLFRSHMKVWRQELNYHGESRWLNCMCVRWVLALCVCVAGTPRFHLHVSCDVREDSCVKIDFLCRGLHTWMDRNTHTQISVASNKQQHTETDERVDTTLVSVYEEAVIALSKGRLYSCVSKHIPERLTESDISQEFEAAHRTTCWILFISFNITRLLHAFLAYSIPYRGFLLSNLFSSVFAERRALTAENNIATVCQLTGQK